VGKALGNPNTDKLRVHFFDNTDPDGIDHTLSEIGESLSTTLALVISKSGGTPETRNGMLEAENAFTQKGLDFSKHAIAITGDGSKLHQYSQEKGWLDFLPMWDWVGGRTSETAAVGLLPAALQGIDIDQLLAGAKQMDGLTRESDFRKNPAAMLALSWHYLTDGKGTKDMVILPYKDRLELFAKYLQQLIMESLGKKRIWKGIWYIREFRFTEIRDRLISMPMYNNCAKGCPISLLLLSRYSKTVMVTRSPWTRMVWTRVIICMDFFWVPGTPFTKRTVNP
jgi:glucose-6-phosphate isomerase